MIVPRYGAHRTPGSAHPKSAPKTLPMFGSNASDEPDHSWVQCPHISVGEHASNDGSNAPDGRGMTRAGADDVARETEGMTVSKGWHGAKHFSAKKKFRVVRGSNVWKGTTGERLRYQPFGPWNHFPDENFEVEPNTYSSESSSSSSDDSGDGGWHHLL